MLYRCDTRNLRLVDDPQANAIKVGRAELVEGSRIEKLLVGDSFENIDVYVNVFDVDRMSDVDEL